MGIWVVKGGVLEAFGYVSDVAESTLTESQKSIIHGPSSLLQYPFRTQRAMKRLKNNHPTPERSPFSTANTPLPTQQPVRPQRPESLDLVDRVRSGNVMAFQTH